MMTLLSAPITIYITLASAALFIALVLIQQKESSLGSMMGSDSGEEIEKTRRGADRMIHNLTVLMAGILLVSSFYFMIWVG